MPSHPKSTPSECEPEADKERLIDADSEGLGDMLIDREYDWVRLKEEDRDCDWEIDCVGDGEEDRDHECEFERDRVTEREFDCDCELD